MRPRPREGWAEIKRRLAARDPPAVRAGRVHLPDQLGLGRHRRRGRARWPSGPGQQHVVDHRPAGRPASCSRSPTWSPRCQGQAPDGRRPEGPAGHRMVTRAAPRLVIAAPASGHGKTTVATGLMARAAQRRAPGRRAQGRAGLHRPGLPRAGHRAARPEPGPAPGRHGPAGAAAAARRSDAGARGHRRHRGRDGPVSTGAIGREGFASTAHVAGLLGAPVILVVDISASSRTVAAVVHGLATFDPAVRIAGVILNKAGVRAARHRGPARHGGPRDAGARGAPPRRRDQRAVTASRVWSRPPSGPMPAASSTGWPRRSRAGRPGRGGPDRRHRTGSGPGGTEGVPPP